MNTPILTLLKKQASCLPDCWCEAPRIQSFIVEPANTWSNIFFFIAGYLIYRKYRPLELNQRIAVITFMYLGIGSSIFHGTLTYFGQLLDVTGMYVLTTFYLFTLLKLDLHKLRNLFFSLWVSLNLGLFFTILYFPLLRRYIFVSILILLVLLSYRIVVRSQNRKLFVRSCLLFLLGVLCWNLDRFKIICNPNSIINLHCFWHLFVAFGGYYYYLFLIERRDNEIPAYNDSSK